MALSYAFDPSKGETAESTRRKRRIVEALLGQTQRTPRSIGEGIHALGSGIAAALLGRQADQAEAAGRSSAKADIERIAPLFPPAPAFGGGSVDPQRATAEANGANLSIGPGGEMPVHRRALLNTISGPESGGDYNVIYGGDQFDDFSDHPRQYVEITSGPNKGKKSSAAGKYQFLAGTFDEYRDKLGLPDFSPGSQDKAAWELASDTYRSATGEDLDQVLQSGDPQAIANVGKVLNGVWTSLPGGIEQGTNTDRFLSAFQRNMSGGGGQDRIQGSVGEDPMGGVEGVYRGGPYNPGNAVADEQLRQVQDQPMNYRTLPTQVVPPTDAGMESPANRAIVQALISQNPMGRPQRFQQPNMSPALQKIADALSPRQAAQQPVQMAQAQGLPEMAGNAQWSGPSMNELLRAGANEWMTDGERGMVNTMLEQQQRRQQADYERQQQMASPEYQLDLKYRQAQLDKLNRESGTDAEFKVVGNQLLRIGRDGQISDVTPQEGGGAPGQFRFEGNSVEAQALNGLMDSGQLTPDQAQQMAAGKTVSGPNGEILFLTPQGVFGQPANGGPPQPVQSGQSRLMSPNSMGGQQMVQPGAPQPVQGPGQQRPGMIPLTGPKVTVDEKDAAGFADRLVESGGLIDTYGKAGGNVWDQAVRGNDYIPDFAENWMVSNDFQNFDQARRNFINAQLRRESGAVISPEEFHNANQQYFPQPGDNESVLKQKAQNRKTAVEAMERSAGPSYKRRSSVPEGAVQALREDPSLAADFDAKYGAGAAARILEGR